MKLRSQDDAVIRYGNQIGEDRQFGIKSTGKAFQVLSSKLYKDKIAAIIRELSCNAFDSHVAAGHPEKPFTIQLPSSLDPNLVIRDYGVGLSHDETVTTFTTFFESTKEDSDDFIGCLGLGSKSPFSMVDSYIVNVYLDGERRSYVCFLENGTPKIRLNSAVASNEQTGLEIVVPVAPEDYPTYEKKAQEIFQWFDVVPEGVTVRPRKVTYAHSIGSERSWEIRDDTWGNDYAVMGQVAYPISRDIIKHPLLEPNYRPRVNLFFDVGELDVQAGREELSYDKQTIEAITQRLDLVRSDIEKVHNKHYRGCKTVFQRYLRYEKASEDYHQLCRLVPPLYGGAKISEGLSALFKGKATVQMYDFREGEDRYKPTREKPIFLLVDSATMVRERISMWRRHKTGCTAYVLGGLNGSVLTPEEVKGLTDLLTGAVVARTSEFKVVRQRAKVRVFKYGGGAAHYLSRENRQEAEVDLASGGVYIVSKTHDLFYHNSDAVIGLHTLQPMVQLCSKYFPSRLVIVPWTRRADFENHPEWKTLGLALYEKFLEHTKDREFVRKLYLARNYRAVQHDFTVSSLKPIADHLDGGHPLKKFIDFAVRCEDAHCEVGLWLHFCEYLTSDRRLTNRYQRRSLLNRLYKTVANEYEMVFDVYRHFGHKKWFHKELAFYANARWKANYIKLLVRDTEQQGEYA